MQATRQSLLSLLAFAIAFANVFSFQSIFRQNCDAASTRRQHQSKNICKYSNSDSNNNNNQHYITSSSSSRRALRRSSLLLAKVQRVEDEATRSEVGARGDDPPQKGGVVIPFKGLVGMEQGSLFSKPIEEYDPLKNTDDLPGADGSPEKIAAIQQRIQQKVAALKAAGEWDVESFGSDPLKNIPLWQIMIMQLKACKPYDSVSELGLTYTLVLITSLALGSYLIFIRDILDGIMPWYVNTDFDAEYFSKLFDFSGILGGSGP